MADSRVSAPLFKRFVQPGRLAVITYGPLVNKTATIVDMVDLRRCIIDGEGIQRQVIPTKWLALTSVRCNIGRGAKAKNLKKALAKEDVAGQWAKTQWAQKMAATAAKKNLTDFERFQLRLAKKKVSSAVKKTLKPVKKAKK